MHGNCFKLWSYFRYLPILVCVPLKKNARHKYRAQRIKIYDAAFGLESQENQFNDDEEKPGGKKPPSDFCDEMIFGFHNAGVLCWDRPDKNEAV